MFHICYINYVKWLRERYHSMYFCEHYAYNATFNKGVWNKMFYECTNSVGCHSRKEILIVTIILKHPMKNILDCFMGQLSIISYVFINLKTLLGHLLRGVLVQNRKSNKIKAIPRIHVLSFLNIPGSYSRSR